jgi:hypothetical protein
LSTRIRCWGMNQRATTPMTAMCETLPKSVREGLTSARSRCPPAPRSQDSGQSFIWTNGTSGSCVRTVTLRFARHVQCRSPKRILLGPITTRSAGQGAACTKGRSSTAARPTGAGRAARLNAARAVRTYPARRRHDPRPGSLLPQRP